MLRSSSSVHVSTDWFHIAGPHPSSSLRPSMLLLDEPRLDLWLPLSLLLIPL